MLRRFDLVVLGGGVAGAKAAHTAASKAKEEGKRFSVALISNEETVYSRSALPSLIANEAHSLKDLIVYPVDELEKLKVKFYRRCEAFSVNFEEQIVFAKNLENRRKLEAGFEKLIIATGSVPKIPPIEGVGLKGVYTIKWFRDIEELSRKIKPGMKALVVGAGFIGLETAEALLKRGLNVTVIEMLPNILLGVLEPKLSSYVRKKAEGKGLTVMTEAKIEEIGGHRSVEYARINDRKFDFDVVVLATGVKPNTKIFAETGVKMTRHDAIRTDKKMQTSIEQIYSVGDCAEKLDFITGKPVHRPLGSLAARTAEIAGLNAFGVETEFAGSIRHQYDYVFNTHISSMGLSSAEASSLGVKTRALPVKLSRENPYFDWELLKRPFGTKMCVIIERGSEKIVGWQSVGTARLTSLYNVYINNLIKNGGRIGDLQEMGLRVP